MIKYMFIMIKIYYVHVVSKTYNNHYLILVTDRDPSPCESRPFFSDYYPSPGNFQHGGRITGGVLTLHQLHFGGLHFLRLAEFVTYNRADIGGPSMRQPMNSLVTSCLGSTWLSYKPPKVSR